MTRWGARSATVYEGSRTRRVSGSEHDGQIRVTPRDRGPVRGPAIAVLRTHETVRGLAQVAERREQHAQVLVAPRDLYLRLRGDERSSRLVEPLDRGVTLTVIPQCDRFVERDDREVALAHTKRLTRVREVIEGEVEIALLRAEHAEVVVARPRLTQPVGLGEELAGAREQRDDVAIAAERVEHRGELLLTRGKLRRVALSVEQLAPRRGEALARVERATEPEQQARREPIAQDLSLGVAGREERRLCRVDGLERFGRSLPTLQADSEAGQCPRSTGRIFGASLVLEPRQLSERVGALAVAVRARLIHRSPFDPAPLGGEVSHRDGADVVMTEP